MIILLTYNLTIWKITVVSLVAVIRTKMELYFTEFQNICWTILENIRLLLTTVYFFRNIFILINLRRKSVKIICQNEFCQRMQYHRYCHIWVKIQIFKTMLLISVKMWNPFLMTTTTFWEENKKKWYRKMFTKSWFHCHYWCN